MDTTNIQLGNIINSKQILDLPLIGRNFTQLELLVPGVQASSDRFGTFSANGAQTQQSNFLVDGTDTNDLPLNTPVFIPSPDSIAQFNFATNSLNPEYGRNSGAIVSASTKSGTNSFHGSAFEFYRDTFLNVRNWFGRPGSTPVFHQNLFGGTLGGPIYKDKAFFFVSYQGIRARQPQNTQSVTVFTAAQRGGNFSSYLGSNGGNNFGNCWPVTVGNGAGGNGLCTSLAPAPSCTGCQQTISNPVPSTISVGALAGCAGLTWRQCLGNGGIVNPATLAASINAITNNLLPFVPLFNTGTNGFSWDPVDRIPFTHQGIARVDFNASTKDQLWGVIKFQHAPDVADLPFTGATVPGFGSMAGRETKQFTVSWTHTFNPTMLNEVRVGFTRFNFDAVEPQVPVLPATVGFAITPQNPGSAGLPVVGVTGFFTLGFSSNGPQPRLDQNRQAADNFTKIAGKHSLKFGVDIRRFNVDNPFFASNSGTYNFSTNATYRTFNPLLDFYVGVPNTYTQNSGARIDAYSWESYVYGQDVWKARHDLTFTMGFGWQVDTQLHARQFGGEAVICFIPGQQSTVFPNNFGIGGTLGPPPGIDYPGDPGCNDAQGAKTQWKNVGPRFGFAYSPNLGRLSAGSSGKFVIRGGVGVYFNRTEEETSLQNLADPPFGLNSFGAGDLGLDSRFANPFCDLNSATCEANKFPASFAQPGQLIDFSVFEPLSLSAFSKDFKVPYSVNYNLTIQRELPANIVLTVSYVGSQGRHEQSTIEQNPISQAGHDDCLINANPNGPLGFNPLTGQFRRCQSASGRNNQPIFIWLSPVPQHSTFPVLTPFGFNVVPSNHLISSTGKSKYNAVQVSATKGPSHGLIFQASYTFAHSLDDGSSFENSGFANAPGGGSRGYNYIFPRLSYGNSAFDARHRFVFSPVYEFPAAKHGIPDVIGEGWKISGILTFASGFPYDISYAGGTSRSLWCSAVWQFYACPDAPNFGTGLVLNNPRNLVGNNTCWFTGGSSGSSACGTGGGFVAEPLGLFGNVSRYKFPGPGINNLDWALQKDIYFWPGHERRYLELRLEMYNALNHTQFNLPSGNFASANFGRITTAAAGRLIQLGAKFYF